MKHIEMYVHQASKNIFWLYILTFAKILLPLVTLPYLTRVLSVESYGVVLFVKSCLVYGRIAVEFGFSLSAVKAIVEVRQSKGESSRLAGEVMTAQLCLALLCLAAYLGMTEVVPLLKQYQLYAVLAFVPVLFDALLLDPLFRAIEKMHMLSVRFVLSQAVVVALTLCLVKGDGDLLLLPVFDIVGAMLAACMSIMGARRLGYCVRAGSMCRAWGHIRESFIYFASNISLTAFNALNTVIIGIAATPAEVAYWAVALQLMGGVQMLYGPITSGIYPQMVATKKRAIILRCFRIFVPLIACGCVFTFFTADGVVHIIAGEGYGESARLLRLLIPVLFFGFLSMLYGWPALGAIGRQKQTTMTTITASAFQCLGLALLFAGGLFSLTAIAVLRCITEVVLFAGRYFFYHKYIHEFR